VSVDLRRASTERGDVVSVELLGEALIEITACLPRLARASAPGEFAQLRCGSIGGPLLRRPFSVAWSDADTCSFVFEVVGAGTRLLAELQPGDILDALGPLGNGFTVAATQRAVCVAGGLGCAPFPFLVRALRQAGVEDIIVLNGAATAARLYPAERFRRGDGDVLVREATDDGSAGHLGYVTELIGDVVRADDAVYVCGPNRMLAAAASLMPFTSRERGDAIVEASLEAPMGCGYGTCLGCALPLRGANAEQRWGLCCTEGPVMRMSSVDWDAMIELPGAEVA